MDLEYSVGFSMGSCARRRGGEGLDPKDGNSGSNERQLANSLTFERMESISGTRVAGRVAQVIVRMSEKTVSGFDPPAILSIPFGYVSML